MHSNKILPLNLYLLQLLLYGGMQAQKYNKALLIPYIIEILTVQMVSYCLHAYLKFQSKTYFIKRDGYETACVFYTFVN